MGDTNQLKDVIKIHSALEKYQEELYLTFVRQFNENADTVVKENLGKEFLINCGRDIAGELVRNCFDTSDFYITVDQLAKRILEFTYDNDYDPLTANCNVGEINKNVLNYNDLSSKELENLAKRIDDAQQPLFDPNVDRTKDPLDREGKKNYRESKKDENGDVYDELTGEKGGRSTYSKNGKEIEKSDLQVDHGQARESARVNGYYVTEDGVQELREFWNSKDNLQMINAAANASKGDIRVCKVDNKIIYMNARSKDYDPSTDITYKATPEQLAEATIQQWEKVDESRENKSQPKIEKLKEKGYLDENGKVPKSVRNSLIKAIRHSQNKESETILKNTKYDVVAKDALMQTKGALGKIIAGQIVYYAAPPLIYEIRTIISEKSMTLDNALETIGKAGGRIGKYVLAHVKDIFINVAHNSLKKFVKSFMDILINIVKATVKKILKMAKRLVLATVDAARVLLNKNADSTQKADSVFNIYGVAITSCVVEIIFEIASDSLHLPPFLSDIVFGPLQILATIVCTNLTMLMLKKLDLFDVQYGYKISNLRRMFEQSREEYNHQLEVAEEYAYDKINLIIEEAKRDCRQIYNNLQEIDVKETSARPMLEKINAMFNMGIDFESGWQAFLGNSMMI